MNIRTVGNLTLISSDPFVQPAINPALLESKFDTGVVVYGFKTLLRFLSAPNFASVSPVPFGRFAELLQAGGLGINPVISQTPEGNAALEEFVRDASGTVFHPVGTAAMAKKGVKAGTKAGVVDSKLRVLGVDGLRVVDASVFVREISFVCCQELTSFQQPFIPSAHTQSPVYVFAERAADLIKVDHPFST